MALIGAHKILRYSHDWEKHSEEDFEWIKIERQNKKFEDFRWVYEGQVSDKKAQGFGVLSRVYKNGEMVKVYAGQWVVGKKEGFGAFWYTNGNFYEGDFCRGRRHGFGRLWSSDGNFYQGHWRDEHFDGPGILMQDNEADGNRYEGNFSRGKKEGFGKFYHLRRGLLQEGFWTNDICKKSTIKDISRDAAPEPTIYPIPELVIKIKI
ncbi:MORN repeat-containing protein 3-like [Fopius arisanus]|uniref:MORN repeat-containing protein 3 n=1 Tax=Fopius arisanus TaxID=64838 RepID=A0A9R1U3A0_9HYME|nr:PREDICTED: MORN repeat-containing protein 3-like [Fopius arisanus]